MPRRERFKFASLQLTRGELALLLGLLERAQEAGWLQPEEQPDVDGLLQEVREQHEEFDDLQQFRRESARAVLGGSGDVDPASVRQMPGAQEVTRGVFLVPDRMETAEEAEARAVALAWERDVGRRQADQIQSGVDALPLNLRPDDQREPN